MKKLVAVALMALSSVSLAGTEIITVPVIDVQPVTQRVGVPHTQRVCSVETVPVQTTVNTSTAGDVITGAIIGGVIGHQIGDGRQRKDNRNIGAVLGGMIGGSSRNQQAIVGHRQVERCKNQTTYVYEDRIRGYEVTYELDGQTNTVRMNRDPGGYIRVQRTVTYRIQ